MNFLKTGVFLYFEVGFLRFLVISYRPTTIIVPYKSFKKIYHGASHL